MTFESKNGTMEEFEKNGTMKEFEDWYYGFGNCVAAALETRTARRSATGGGALEDDGLSRPDRASGIVAAASARLEAKDLGPAHDVFAGQALVLDEIFTQFASMAAYNAYDYQTFMNIALKAQSQCRWTLKALMAMNDPRLARSRPTVPSVASAPLVGGDGRQEFCEQTNENGKISA